MNMKKIPDRIGGALRRHTLLLFSFLTAAVTLAICSKSSPLYPMNDWVDVHCFLTLGKGMLHGLVPYVDLYEQKGPVLYFIYAIVAMFSQNSFFGQYLLEIITFGLFLFFSGKIAKLYLGESWAIYPTISILAAAVAATQAFAHGGSVEQLCLFTFTYGLYTVLDASKHARGLTSREALINGIFAGMVFWIKYSMLGFYIGLAVFVLIWYAIWIRDGKQLMMVIGQFLLGVLIVTIPVFLYFLMTNALDDLFTAYFYNNIFLYPNETEDTLLTLIQNGLDRAVLLNGKLATLHYLGLIYLLIRTKEAPRDITVVCISFFGLAATTYLGKGYSYYALVFAAYTVFGLIGAVQVIRKLGITKLFHQLIGDALLPKALSMLCVSLLCLNYALSFSQNTYLMDYEKEDMPQYQFAQIMNERKEDPTLLNLGFLDGGFYYAADILPNCPFFCSFNVEAPGMWDTHYQYIAEKKVDFIITRTTPLERYYPNSGYELIATASMYFETYDFDYYLYALKEDG